MHSLAHTAARAAPRVGLAAGLLVALALLCTAPIAAVAADQQQTQSQLQQLKAEMSKLQQLLQGFKSERSKLQDTLRESEVDIGKAQQRIREIEKALQQQEHELKQLRQQRDQLQQSRADQQAHIARQMRSAYELGRQDKLKTLLNQEDPAQVSRMLIYYDYFSRARSAQIDNYLALIAELDRLEPDIESRADALRQAKHELDQQQQQLVAARRERRQALDQLAGTIESKDAELRQLAQDRSALEAVLRRLERESRAAPKPIAPGRDAGALVHRGKPAPPDRPFGDLRGQLPWPVSGRPDNRFGSSRGTSDLKWQGINIIAAEGTPVHAIHTGEVVFADWLRGSGLLIIIDHGAGYLSLYAHNQSLLRSVGDRVAGGDAIATVGSSGGQQHAALYFEIRHRGVPTDPARWCRHS